MRTHILAPWLLALASASCGVLDWVDPYGESSHTEPVRPSQHAKFPQLVLQKNLVSDQSSLAEIRDSNMVNSWGLAFSPEGLAWAMENGAGVVSVYDAKANTAATIGIPALENSGSSAPTGVAYNVDQSSFEGDSIVFVTAQGTIAGWQQGFDGMARMRVDNSAQGSMYTGVAVARAGWGYRLFAVDFQNARIDVFENDYQPVYLEEASFFDPALPSDYAPFNIVATNDLLLVSYAKQRLPDRTVAEKGPGNGFIDVYDARGHFLERLISRDVLDSPWGMAITPRGYARIPNRLLVGNSGDGRIAVYDLSLRGLRLNATYEGYLGNADNDVLAIDGLRGLAFPPNAGGFDAHHLHFTAGPSDGQHGLFGRLELAKTQR